MMETKAPVSSAVHYDSKEVELRLLAFWDKERVYKFDPEQKGEIYSIDTPPPTVSGRMHIGHAFSYAQQDIIARYKRLRGFNVFYPWGTDDNGLPTERLVEKLKNVKGSKMDRQAFIALCEQTRKELLPDFIADWKRIGVSCDFSMSYSTIDANCRRISQWSLIDLNKKGRFYRKNAPALWCPLCETGISQMECQDAEKPSTFNDIVFKVDGMELIIATTRPELLPACVAIFAHPNDDRYKKLIGKKAVVPLFNHEVQIYADGRVDPSKGSGIVMCCTFGDQTDMQWYLAFNLPLKEAIAKNGKLTALAGKYQGLSVHDARKAMLADLKSAGLLRHQKPIQHPVKVHERCQTEIEIIQSKQWFIKYLDLKEKMIEWGSELRWHPDFMVHRYNNWVNGLQWDWLVSRQRFFGVPMPVWYCKKCDEAVLADEKNLPVDPLIDQPPIKKCKCGSTEFVPEKDILDTWVTSSMTPKLAAELLPAKYRSKVFPMSLRPQAHEIISFWLFNTLFKSEIHFNSVPWRDVALSGYVTDPQGEKMSKSKGNIVAPETVLAKYSADALRYWAGGSKLGEDIAYQEKELVAGDRFVKKLWNVAKFIAPQIESFDSKGKVSEVLDFWILSRLAQTISAAAEAFDHYEYSKARMVIDQFFWRDFCDNYVELVKNRAYEGSAAEKLSCQVALLACLSAVVRLMAPFTPFICEEVYQLYLKSREGVKSVHLSGWPVAPKVDESAEKVGEVVLAVLAAVRKKKSEAKVSMKVPLKRLVIECSVDISAALDDLKATVNAERVEIGKASEEVVPGVKVTAEF
ncbi:valine--tRNA ligase [Candidatus Woesearchaeota archaeon]|nr:valine--tRNA ligase [Candidatus Woesearchaeota archaeon]